MLLPFNRLRVMWLGVYAVCLVTLAASSYQRRTGDAGEYLAMALNLSRLRPPSIAPAELSAYETEFAALNRGFDAGTLRYRELVDSGGRQDFVHFWLYPLIVVPAIWLTRLAAVLPTWAFTITNAWLLLLGAAVVSRRIGWLWAVALFAGPVVWWSDKVQVEAFVFALLAIGTCLLRQSPGLAVLALAAAAAQNPAMLLLWGLGIAAIILDGRARSGRWWMAVTASALLAALPVLYYQWRLGTLSPLADTSTNAWPSIGRLLACLVDLNIGLVANAPFFAMLLMVAVVSALRSWRELSRGERLFVPFGVLGLLVAFAQPVNLNHGGTPGMSRYALWLTPLAIPLLAALRLESARWPRVAAIALVAASATWSLVTFHPRRAEQYLAPTALAELIWMRAPGLDNPEPEIFAERASRAEPGFLPMGTADCSKILTIGTRWPATCLPAWPMDSVCQLADALCDANRRGDGYAFVRLGMRRGREFAAFPETWDASNPGVREFADIARRAGLHALSSRELDRVLRALDGVPWARGWVGEHALAVYLPDARAGAALHLRVAEDLSGQLVDLESRTVLAEVMLQAGLPSPQLVQVPVAARHAALLLGRSLAQPVAPR